ncbi:MAG: RNA pseudouridine synthase [Bacteroidales bacterium]|nr:RNA pseudouridine synthase [Bacteroidales bacterium]MDZ4204507.1 RNA pseudouridine synthase [Bacteroidales bacterium]
MDNVNYISQRVLYEDNHLLVINKMAGEIVQGDRTGDKPLLEKVKDYIKVKYNKPGKVFLGLPHRLDQPVSGAVIFARTSKALARLNTMIHDREITKIYWAVVKNRPPKDQDTLVHYMSRNREKNKSYAFNQERKNTTRAELQYQILAESDNYYLLEIKLITGRHHQIRSQLSVLDCPIKGDLKYGAPRPNPDASIHLHARNVCFIHPVSGKVTDVFAPAPDEPLWQYFENLFPLTTVGILDE